MIEGCKALPYIGVQHRQAEGEVLDCTRCKSSLPYKHRARMGCGWIPTRRWANSISLVRVPGTNPNEHTICPYYAATLPQVHEVAVAWTWRDKGQLQVRYEQPAPILLDLIDLYHGAVTGAQDYMLKETQRKAQRHGR